MRCFVDFCCPNCYFMHYVSHRIATICKDYCGSLNEESVRCNFTLIYEILDEVLVSILCLLKTY